VWHPNRKEKKRTYRDTYNGKKKRKIILPEHPTTFTGKPSGKRRRGGRGESSIN